jgi:hypothetical protein
VLKQDRALRLVDLPREGGRQAVVKGVLLFKGGPFAEKSDLREPKEDQTEDGLGILRRGEAGVGAELVAGRRSAAAGTLSMLPGC